MYTLEMLKFLAPFAGALCIENFVYRQGELCNIRDYPANVVKYDKPVSYTHLTLPTNREV